MHNDRIAMVEAMKDLEESVLDRLLDLVGGEVDLITADIDALLEANVSPRMTAKLMAFLGRRSSMRSSLSIMLIPDGE